MRVCDICKQVGDIVVGTEAAPGMDLCNHHQGQFNEAQTILRSIWTSGAWRNADKERELYSRLIPARHPNVPKLSAT